MSSKNYLYFSAEDFASDTYFQKWILEDDHMTNLFWEKWLVDNPKKRTDIDLAKKIISQLTFKKYIATSEDFNEVWKDIKETQMGVESSVESSRNKWYVGAAAAIVILISSAIFLNKGDGVEFINIDTPVIVNNIEIGYDKAILTTENGEDIVLEEGKQYVSDNISSDGKGIIYKNTGANTKAEIAYNYMTVPRGGQFYIELSDNTKVWLNSDSKIKYPKVFIANQDRNVELIYGEAYFDVSSSSNHNGAKFKAFTKGQEVEVLGTEFNIKSYQNENLIFTTLVEGKVQVVNAEEGTQLAPNQQSIVNINTNDLKVNEVNVYDQISWKEGVFSFNSKPLKEIMNTLERWYNVEIVFGNTDLENVRFIGIFRKDQNIEQILLQIKNTNRINQYDIEDKKIILK